MRSTTCDLCARANALVYVQAPTLSRVMPTLDIDVCQSCKDLLEHDHQASTAPAYEVLIEALKLLRSERVCDRQGPGN